MSPASHLEFAPPPPPGGMRAFGIALVIHAALMAALTWGVRWQHDNSVGVEAELWSAIPQLAAPKGETLEAPPTPPPEPKPETPPVPKPVPQPPPKPEPKATPKPAPSKDADLAIEKKKKAEKDKEDKLKAQQEARQKAEKERKDKLLQEKEQKEKQAREKALQEQRDKAEEKKREALRQEQLRRVMGMADATGSAGSSGKSSQTSGPPAGYSGKLAALFLNNITYTEHPKGNPKAELRVFCDASGRITSVKLEQESGVKSWDEAVEKAIWKTAKIPPDPNGKYWCPFPVGFEPNDRDRIR